MSGNTFGKLFTVTTFGESHGPALGAIIDGCPPGYYSSAMVHRAGEVPAKGARLAYNEPNSQSGFGAAQGFGFLPTIETGAHALSLEAVVRGDADVAFIDHHTLKIVGLPAGLHVAATTPPTPGTPIVTAREEWVTPLRAALLRAFEAFEETHRDMLGLTGFHVLDVADYYAVALPPTP